MLGTYHRGLYFEKIGQFKELQKNTKTLIQKLKLAT